MRKPARPAGTDGSVLTVGHWIGQRTLVIGASTLIEAGRRRRREVPFASVRSVRLERTRGRFGHQALRLVLGTDAGDMAIGRPTGRGKAAFAPFVAQLVRRIAVASPNAMMAEGLGEGTWRAWVATGALCAAVLIACLAALPFAEVPFATLPLAVPAAGGLLAAWMNARHGRPMAMAAQELAKALAQPAAASAMGRPAARPTGTG